MKYIIHAIVWIAVFGALYYLFSKDNNVVIVNYPPKNEVIVAFGDSLVEGVGASPQDNFVALLSKELGKPIINLGKSGDTTKSALARLDEIKKHDPGIVMVLLGGNDALRRVPKTETKENLSAIIEELQNAGAIVILLGVQSGIFGDSYDEMFEELSRKSGTAYVSNVLQGLIGKPEFMYDTIHPNGKGYARIAERVLPVIKELLN
jgi:acyl-CoA thioesterase I